MSESAGNLEFDTSQSVLLPETGSLAIKAFEVMNEGLKLPVWFSEMPLDEALDLLEAKKVAAVLAGASNTTGDVIKAGIHKFNPRRDEAGEADIKGERKLVSSFFIFERDGDDPFVMADCAVNTSPEEHELLAIAEQTIKNAGRLGIDPHVAFLSYSTIGSGHGDPAKKTRAVVRRFKEIHPDIPTIGEVQWDAANYESIYEMKTKQKWPGKLPPNVFIAPDLNTGNSLYKALQDRRKGGGWTAAGPLLQGFENDSQLHDLSRGVTPEALAVICKYVAKLSGLIVPDEHISPSQSSPASGS
jgi:phosphate acetyltransferase